MFKYLAVLTAFFWITQASAQGATTTSASYDDDSSGAVAHGVRVSAIKAIDPKVETQSNFGGSESSDSEDVDQDFGVQIGYISVFPQEFGFMGGLTYSQLEDNELQTYRLEGNLAYGFTSNLYGYGGINVQQLEFDGDDLRGEDYSIEIDVDPKIGFQLGLGFQATKNVGFGLAYVVTNNDGDIVAKHISGQSIRSSFELEMSAFEFSIVGTF